MEIAEQIIKRQEDLARDRSVLESHWEEIADRVLPRQRGMMLSNSAIRTEGEKRTEKMFDATAALGLERFAAAMESMLTPRNSRWHRLQASNDELNRIREVQLWFEQATNLLFRERYSPKANYASQQHEDYMALGAFGTGAIYIDALDSPNGGLRYKSIHLGGLYFAENHQGIVDTAYRRYRMTARQAAQKWGPDNLPARIEKAAKDEPNKDFEFIHCVMPREGYDPERRDAKGMPFASYYVSVEEKKLMSEGGYVSFPYAISRYVTAPDETYGRSPAMLALPSIKTLNEQKKTVLKQGHRTVDPVLLAHDDGIVDTFSLKPGAVNAGGVSAEGRPLVHAMPSGNLAVGWQMMDQERATINDAFLVTLFQILVDTPQMTATEVLERAREKGALLSPTMGRQQSEKLGPMIERELDLLAMQGKLPPMPEVLREAAGEYEVQYDSPLSRAQKAEEAVGLSRTMEMVMPYVQLTADTSPLDHFNWDEITPQLANINAVPASWRRALGDIAQIRESRQQQAEQQQAIDAAPAVAGLMKATPQ